MVPDSPLLLALAALVLEAAIGYPQALYRVIGHPVTWIGWLIAALERLLNREKWSANMRRMTGILTLMVLLAVVGGVSYGVEWLLSETLIGFVGLVLIASSLPAQRSLDEHVRAVAEGLEKDGLDGGRRSVAMIVGRNPDMLDESGVSRAAIESLAENFSDGVVAPLFWMAVGGLPGAALYKAANTADSMIGHRTPRYENFGWAAARFDDLINLPASRLAALWIVLAALFMPRTSAREAVRAIFRDARKHRSPNAGWPEAAMAGALGLKLAGPRVYGSELVNDAYMGDGRRDAGAGDIRHALRLYRGACLIEALVLAGLVIVLMVLRQG
jgi:adenosylcobinamide-phosphate synthase